MIGGFQTTAVFLEFVSFSLAFAAFYSDTELFFRHNIEVLCCMIVRMFLKNVDKHTLLFLLLLLLLFGGVTSFVDLRSAALCFVAQYVHDRVRRLIIALREKNFL